jgi:hypothetical protein
MGLSSPNTTAIETISRELELCFRFGDGGLRQFPKALQQERPDCRQQLGRENGATDHTAVQDGTAVGVGPAPDRSPTTGTWDDDLSSGHSTPVYLVRLTVR